MSQWKKIFRACACASLGEMRKENEFSLISSPLRFVKGSHVSSLSSQPIHLVLKRCSGLLPFSTPCSCLPHLTPTMQSTSQIPLSVASSFPLTSSMRSTSQVCPPLLPSSSQVCPPPTQSSSSVSSSFHFSTSPSSLLVASSVPPPSPSRSFGAGSSSLSAPVP